MEKCLITKLQTVISDTNIPKLGGMYLTLKKRYDNKSIGVCIAVAETDNVTIEIISGGYICKSSTDSTPLNGTIDNSKQIIVPNAITANKYDDTGFVCFYFQSEEIIVYINDKYNFMGFGLNPMFYTQPNFLKYELENIKYLSNWTYFAMSDRKIKVQDIPSKILTSAYYNTDGNFDGITLGALSSISNVNYKRGYVYDNNVTGIIKKITCAVELEGTFTYNITNTESEVLMLYSPNVYGDVTSYIGGQIDLGNSNIYTNVTCNSPLSSKIADRYFHLYSNVLTLEMLGNLLNTPSKNEFEIGSKQFTADEVASNTSIMEKITACKNLGATITINSQTF